MREVLVRLAADHPVRVATVGEVMPADSVRRLLGPAAQEWRRAVGEGWSSVSLRLSSVRPAGRRLIYQEGHFGSGACERTLCLEAGAARLLRAALDRGYDVVVLWLPWHGPNVGADGPGTVEAWRARQGDERLLVSILAPLRAAAQDGEGGELVLAGLSYGGSIVPLYAALDPRVTRAYEIDGNPPVACWNWVACLLQLGKSGDRLPYLPWNFDGMAPLAGRFTQFDLYLLAAQGPGKFVQLANRGFAGNFIESYRDSLAAAAQRAGGCYAGVLHDNDAHEIAEPMIDWILDDRIAC